MLNRDILRSLERQESVGQYKKKRHVRERAYRELHKAKDQHGPETPKIRIGEEPTKE